LGTEFEDIMRFSIDKFIQLSTESQDKILTLLDELWQQEHSEENIQVAPPLPFSPRQAIKKSYSLDELLDIVSLYPADFEWTYEKLKELLPFEYKLKIELIQQKLCIYPNPIATEPEIVSNIVFMMLQIVEKKRRGELLFAPFDVVLDEYNVVQPAVAFVIYSRRKIVKENVIRGVPDLVLEIVSSTESVQEREQKRELYEKFGVKEYWEVRPDRKRIEVEILQDGRFVPFVKARRNGKVKSHILKGFVLALEDIFEAE
jgi:Uma2 family endonuclease